MRLCFIVNITNFHIYLIYIMKLQVLLILWSFLKSLLVLGLHYVATSQFIQTDSSFLDTFLMLLTLLCNIFHKSQVTSLST